MRVTVCETPHEPEELDAFWKSLCVHTQIEHSELLVLPEFAFLPPVWQADAFDASVWRNIVAASSMWLGRFQELGCEFVIGARPSTEGGKPYNQGFIWSANFGVSLLRRKRYLPNEPMGWEERWFARGHEEFPVFAAGPMSFGLNICTELWALETYSGYAATQVNAIVSPRATSAGTTEKWISVGTVAAVRTGAFCISSNRVHADGSCGGVGWIIGPDGEILGRTSPRTHFVTRDIDFTMCDVARATYPRYVFTSN